VGEGGLLPDPYGSVDDEQDRTREDVAVTQSAVYRRMCEIYARWSLSLLQAEDVRALSEMWGAVLAVGKWRVACEAFLFG